MIYGAETQATTKQKEQRLDVNDMRRLIWMCGVTRKDEIRNEYIRVANTSSKVTERRLEWFGHLKPSAHEQIGRAVPAHDANC